MTHLEIFVCLLAVAVDKYDLNMETKSCELCFYLIDSVFSSNLSHMHVILFCEKLTF